MKQLHNNLSKDEKKTLVGHRKRLRKRYLTQNGDDIENNRLLELLLTYSIPQKDVYLLANSLISTFGGISGVLNAKVDDLKATDGIGENTALLIHLVSTLQRKKILDESERKVFKSVDEVAEEACRLLRGINEERILFITFNSAMKMLSYSYITDNHPGECIIDSRKAAKVLLREGVAYVAVAHNHPSGNIHPSAEDIFALSELEKLIRTVSVKIIDMFIVSDSSYFRMSEAAKLSGKLNDLPDECIPYTFCNDVSPETVELIESINNYKQN